MKKFLFAVGTIVCVALLSVCFSSCGDNDDEPLAALYSVGGNTTNEATTITADQSETPQIEANIEALRAELKAIIKNDSWSASLNNKTKDEVLKREDEIAKKKFDEMVTKVNA